MVPLARLLERNPPSAKKQLKYGTGRTGCARLLVIGVALGCVRLMRPEREGTG